MPFCIDYRELPDDRTEQFQHSLKHAFNPEDGPQDEHKWDPAERPGEALKCSERSMESTSNRVHD